MSENQESKNADKNDLDSVLHEVGEFGKHQIFQFFLIALPIIFASVYAVEYIVTSSTIDYRCKIPECDSSTSSNFDQSWLKNAIPYKHGRPSKCLRFARNPETSLRVTSLSGNETCSFDAFNRSHIVTCDEHIFKTDEHRIIREFNVLCDENEYKLALVGTVNNIGGFLLMPFCGFLSDKFGRLRVLIWSLFGNAIFGLIKANVTSYTAFMFCEFLGAAVGTTSYMAAFVLCVEWVSTKNRVLSSFLVTFIYPFGEIMLGLAAMYFNHYRSFLIFLYVPTLFVISYFWLVPESIRWLVATKRKDRALEILSASAKHNNRTLSEHSVQVIHTLCENEMKVDELKEQRSESLVDIFRHKVLVLRLIVCSMCWIVVVHIFYGLSLNATKIADDDNKYLSYITTMAAELPAACIAFALLEFSKRRIGLCVPLVTAGVATISTTFVPASQVILLRVLFSTAMCATSSSFAVLYTYSAEMWPTAQRNTMMNLCSMMGRCGSMLAPLTTLLAQVMPQLPFLIFGGSALMAGFLLFMLPETQKKKLPDTIDEACRL